MTLTGMVSEFRSNIKDFKKVTEREREREREAKREQKRNMPVNCHESNHANESR